MRDSLKTRKSALLNRFGKIAMVTVNVFWHRPQSYYDLDDLRGTINMDGGSLIYQSSHYVDLLDWLFGPIENLSAFTETIKRDIEAEDTASAQIKKMDGAKVIDRKRSNC